MSSNILTTFSIQGWSTCPRDCVAISRRSPRGTLYSDSFECNPSFWIRLICNRDQTNWIACWLSKLTVGHDSKSSKCYHLPCLWKAHQCTSALQPRIPCFPACQLGLEKQLWKAESSTEKHYEPTRIAVTSGIDMQRWFHAGCRISSLSCAQHYERSPEHCCRWLDKVSVCR